ncbi:MAG: YfcE family phosphodiesterase [Chloroflexi bacterium]|nr:YfcE family phosphodiesterase [Chloroflexota bacterium]MCI0840649.1 YfcE family phosphodiesterase [Chloroflexota bacterium]
MSTKIVVISDTHLHRWDDVHPDIRRAAAEADIAVHCGDFVRMDVLEGFRREAKRSFAVHGNTDPVDLRNAIPYVDVIESEGRRIGVIHPAWGGPEFEPEALLPDFPGPVDVILYGHLHIPMNEERNGVLFVNPGQAYASFRVPATIAVLTLDEGEVSVEIREVEAAH